MIDQSQPWPCWSGTKVSRKVGVGLNPSSVYLAYPLPWAWNCFPARQRYPLAAGYLGAGGGLKRTEHRARCRGSTNTASVYFVPPWRIHQGCQAVMCMAWGTEVLNISSERQLRDFYSLTRCMPYEMGQHHRPWGSATIVGQLSRERNGRGWSLQPCLRACAGKWGWECQESLAATLALKLHITLYKFSHRDLGPLSVRGQASKMVSLWISFCTQMNFVSVGQ